MLAFAVRLSAAGKLESKEEPTDQSEQVKSIWKLNAYLIRRGRYLNSSTRVELRTFVAFAATNIFCFQLTLYRERINLSDTKNSVQSTTANGSKSFGFMLRKVL